MFGRVARLEARYDGESDPFFIIEGLRIRFEMNSNLAQGLSRCKITVFNLSVEEAKSLINVDHESSSTGDGTEDKDVRGTNIRLFAGYADELVNGRPNLLIEGKLMNATVLKAPPESQTTLYVLPLSSFKTRRTFDAFNTTEDPYADEPKHLSLKEVLTKMCTDEKVGFLEESLHFLISEEQQNEKIENESINPDPKNGLVGELYRLAKNHSFEWAPRADGLGFYPYMDDSEKGRQRIGEYVEQDGQYAPYYIDPRIVKGTPIAGVMTLEIPIVLTPHLAPGYMIDVRGISDQESGALQTQGIISSQGLDASVYYTDDIAKYSVSQYYMIDTVVHVGDTHSEDWKSTLVCKTFTAGEPGNGELGRNDGQT